MTAAPRFPAWPVALERNIRPYHLARGSLDGMQLVLWRCDRGEIHVWEDNCPHRSVRLSAGRNLGESVEDIYHGWRFGRDGAVVFIPAEHDKAPPKVSARVLATCTASGLVWAGFGAKAAPTPGFEIAADEALIRPLPIAASADRITAGCAKLEGARLLATPTGDVSATVYGFVRRRPGERDIEASRRANAVLTSLRRKLERSE